MNFRDFEALVPDDEDLEVILEEDGDENAINRGNTSKVDVEAQNAGNHHDRLETEEIESKDFEIRGEVVQVSNKRQKIEETLEEEGEDRFSELPDSVLLQILSLLPTSQEVIRTGILSKRWQYLWTTIPVLSFVNDDKTSARKFASFVDATLIQCRHSKIDRFKLDFRWDKDGLDYGDQIYSWIHYAVTCKVEELEISLDGNDDEPVYYYVPWLLLAHSCLTNLKLGRFHFPSSKVSWKLLKRLWLHAIDLSGDVIENILTGCPVLDVLKLESCGGIRCLDIKSTSVKTLIMDEFIGSIQEVGEDESLVISAPNITSLELMGNWWVKKLVLVVENSLVEAKVDFWCRCLLVSGDVDDGASQELAEQMWIGLLKSLENVKELTVGNWCLSVLGHLELQFRLSPRLNCKCLIINNSLRRRAFLGFVHLMRSLHVLETLLINANPPFKFKISGGFHTRANYLALRRFYLPCLVKHLKTIKIAYYVEWDREGEVLQFLLDNACVLEELVIHVRSVRSKKLTSVPELLLQVTQKLLSFPRASSDAVVTFHG